MEKLYENPDKYGGKKIQLIGYFPQALPAIGCAENSEGDPMTTIYNYDCTEGVAVEGNTSNLSGTFVRIEGTFEKKDYSPIHYAITLDNFVNLGPIGSAGGIGVNYGESIDELPSSGQIFFTENGMNIRNGENGLESEKSGLVFNEGDHVNYDKTYQKDGYTWIAYTGQSGQRHSVAVGNDKTLLYGYYFVPIKS
ncbi:SH3 domain-containing protein [Ileibacterium valens]|uniref:SH3b domain-containing protein n=1 Tax=Ileibacterium valens TaxID=1862668 RepID=A0A1U7NFI5_9FIRM|nr:SH3 domain-containing protein [Ileibacterium valens]OLU39083.1 hypothetical protein BO222_07330 [Ileibacterium valens]OLU41732.1 hypothetical protein BM735_03745 [Erysipelotrichaceae bacterium NYU-BL-F16]OLU41821.1 hypothetical protein BO224_02930 [Erysipelotrichaceae bacterium NYU-BL-E8]